MAKERPGCRSRVVKAGAFALGLLSSLPVLPKSGRGGEGADWVSKGPRLEVCRVLLSSAPNGVCPWPIHVPSEASCLGPDQWL